MRKIVIIICIVLSSGFLHAQTMEIGVFGGGSYYLGELNPGFHFLNTKPAYGLVARFNHGSRWTLKLSGYRGKVEGDDNNVNGNAVRGLKFESQLTDIAAVLEFNFLDYFTGSNRNDWSPYIFGGVGVVMFNPKADGIVLRDLGTEGQNESSVGRDQYSLIAFTIPFGVGLKYSLSSRFGLGFEWGMRKVYTDYIDDISTTYYLDGSSIDPDNIAEVYSDPTFAHQPNQQRGNSSTKDWYNFVGITLTYRIDLFGKGKCPDQRR